MARRRWSREDIDKALQEIDRLERESREAREARGQVHRPKVVRRTALGNCPKFLHPHDYPLWLLRVIPTLANDWSGLATTATTDECLVDLLGGRVHETMSSATNKRLLKEISTPYLFAARGMNGVPYELLHNLDKLLSPSEYDGQQLHDQPASMNVALASNFAAPSKTLVYEARTYKQPLMSVLFTMKLQSKNIAGFGGDSESGPLHEAEVRVRRCIECVDRVFVGGQHKFLPKLRKATKAEVNLYALSNRFSINDMTFFPLALYKKLSPAILKPYGSWGRPSVKKVSSPINEHGKVPKDWTWYAL